MEKKPKSQGQNSMSITNCPLANCLMHFFFCCFYARGNHLENTYGLHGNLSDQHICVWPFSVVWCYGNDHIKMSTASIRIETLIRALIRTQMTSLIDPSRPPLIQFENCVNNNILKYHLPSPSPSKHMYNCTLITQTVSNIF